MDGMFSRILNLAFLALIAAAFTPSVVAQVSPVRLRVEQVSKSDTNSYKTVQSRSLNVQVSNSSLEAVELKLKYVIFGRNMKGGDIVTVGQGEVPVSVKPQGTEKLTTPPATAVSQEARTGSKGKSEEAGSRIMGQGVQAWKGETMVAEYYEPASVKEHFGKAPPAEILDKKKK